MSLNIYLPSDFDYSENKETFLELAGEMFFSQILSSSSNDNFCLSYIPVEYVRNSDSCRFHIASLNEHVDLLKDGSVVSFIWTGPHFYISPTLYVNNSVPTWNYAAAILEGKVNEIHDYAEKRQHLENVTKYYEEKNGSNWQIESLGDERFNKVLERLRFFKADIINIKLKLKMSQNKQEEDRIAVQEALSKINNAVSVAEIMGKFNKYSK